MLNPFPELLTFGLLAPFILRIIVGVYFFNAGLENLTREQRESKATLLRVEWGPFGTFMIWGLGLAEVLIGLSFILGFLTQFGAILAILVAAKLFVFSDRYPMLADQTKSFYLVIIAIALSLLLSGAGGFAFDLPL